MIIGMIMKRDYKKKSKGASTIEYAALFTMILVAFWFGMRVYIQRGIQGRWKATGDTFGQGRQYQPKASDAVKKTTECFYSEEVMMWVGQDCSKKCDCSLEEDDLEYVSQCLDCMRVTCPCPF